MGTKGGLLDYTPPKITPHKDVSLEDILGVKTMQDNGVMGSKWNFLDFAPKTNPQKDVR